MPPNHGSEILPLLVNRYMPAPSKRLLDLAKLGTHSLSLRHAPELETGTTLLCAAIVCQPEEVERFRRGTRRAGDPMLVTDPAYHCGSEGLAGRAREALAIEKSSDVPIVVLACQCSDSVDDARGITQRIGAVWR